MPPVSQAQARFLLSQHPEIASRWKAEGAWPSSFKGLPQHVKQPSSHPAIAKASMYVSAKPSNESNQPGTSKLPRLPGNKRDFGMLQPPAHARFIPKNKPYPNQQESDQEGPVKGMGDTYERGHRLMKHEIKHPPNHTTNVKRAHKRIGF